MKGRIVAWLEARKIALFSARLICACFYFIVVALNLPPIIKSDNVSMHWNFLPLGGVGIVGFSISAVLSLVQLRGMGVFVKWYAVVEAVSVGLCGLWLLWRWSRFFAM